MNDRIKQLIEYYDISIRAFEQKICVSESLIYRGLTRNSDFGASVIIKILNYCPDVSPDWLLLGKGEMFRKDGTNSETFYKNFIADKEYKIEELTRENERLRLENEALKSPSSGAGIIVQHDGGNNNYNNNTDLMPLVTSQQMEIRDLTEQNKKLTEIIANKL